VTGGVLVWSSARRFNRYAVRWLAINDIFLAVGNAAARVCVFAVAMMPLVRADVPGCGLLQVMYARQHEREAMKDALEMAVLTSVRHPNIIQVCM